MILQSENICTHISTAPRASQTTVQHPGLGYGARGAVPLSTVAAIKTAPRGIITEKPKVTLHDRTGASPIVSRRLLVFFPNTAWPPVCPARQRLGQPSIFRGGASEKKEIVFISIRLNVT